MGRKKDPGSFCVLGMTRIPDASKFNKPPTGSSPGHHLRQEMNTVSPSNLSHSMSMTLMALRP